MDTIARTHARGPDEPTDLRLLLRLMLERLERMERQLSRVVDDVDAIDRTLRPFGDGARTPRRRSA